ncbi:hypothetical protein AC1031_011215 [Aphanomyces cochlioides]|nr:hypothetical protein AC1031_011215 [Aphanomyces cochlioides]
MAALEAKDDEPSGLPTEVLIKIALSIPDATTLFSFLEAICPYIALGPLEQLYQLGRQVKHSDLWPSLVLNASTLQTLSNSLHLDFVKYYSNVKLTNGWNAVEWLKTHLKPRTTIEWQISMFPETTETSNEWAEMQITQLSVYLNYNTPYSFSNKLPRLPHLTSLSVVEVDYGDLEVILEYLAKSEKITACEVFAESGDWVGEAEVNDLLEWFRRQPVRELDFNFEGWEDLSPELRQTLCEAMFNCTTMERLALRNCFLNDMDFSKFSFSMKTLEFDEVSFDDDCLIALAKQLEGSNVTRLEVKDFIVDGNMEGIACLLGVLPRTNIKTFGLSNFRLQSDSRDKLPPLI